MISSLMALLYWSIFSILTFCSWKNWKRTVIVWIPLSMLFNECVCLKYTPPAVTLGLAVDVMLLFLYYVKGINQLGLNRAPYFFRNAFIAYLISYGISMVISIMSFTEVATNTIKYFLENFVIIFLFFRALNTKKDCKLFVRVSCIVMGVIMVLGVFEAVSKDNPWLDLVYFGSPIELIKEKMYYVPHYLTYESADMRFGMRRCYSFFHIHIAYGCACVMYLFLYLHLLNSRYGDRKLLLFATLCALIGILICNSKTGMLGLLFFTIACFSRRQILDFRLIIAVIVGLSLVIMYIPEYLNNMMALFDNSIMEEGGGSSTALRKRQYEIGINMFLSNPIVGNGVNSLSVLSKTVSNADILGSESSWLKILPQRGLIGAAAYLYLYALIYRKLSSVLPQKKLLLFLLGIIVMETATGFMKFTIFGAIVVFLWRHGQLVKREKEIANISRTTITKLQ